MNKKTNKKKVNGEKAKRPAGVGGDRTAQDSEYRDLRQRVGARKDAEEILKIAKKIDRSFDDEAEQ
jgi:hypothetical protein